MTTPARFFSLEEVAKRLGLHVRTVRAYVRTGRLRAARIGKQYRVTREDLESLVGRPIAAPAARHQVDVSSIVLVESIDFDTASRIRNGLLAALKATPDEDAATRVDTMYDKDTARLKVIVSGSPDVTARLLRLITVYLEE